MFGSEKFLCVYLDVDIVQLQTRRVDGYVLSHSVLGHYRTSLTCTG